MNAAIDLFTSCKKNTFPSLATMAKYGLNGEGKANPIDIFNCYKKLIQSGEVSEHDFCKTENENINNLLKNNNHIFVNYLPYKRLYNNGGIVIADKTIIECDKCFYNGLNKKCC